MFNHARQLLKDSSVASIAPTTPASVRQIGQLINFAKAQVIVEYGPGDGAVTSHLLRNMKPDSRLVAIETNKNFVSVLHKRFTDDRISIVNDSAENVTAIMQKLDLPEADYIISGIPFSFIDPDTKDQIIGATASALHTSGSFIVYQALTAFGARKSLKKAMNRHFITADRKPLLLNLPPLYVIEGTPLRAENN